MLGTELLGKALARIARHHAIAPVGCVALAPGTCIAFVGSHQISLAAGLIGCNGIRQIHAQHARPGADIRLQVCVRCIDALACNAVVLVAERHHIQHLGGVHIDDGQGIVLLQRGPGGLAVRRKRDVLGLEIAGGIGIRTKDANALLAQLALAPIERTEVRRAHDRSLHIVDVNDADGAFRIGLVVIARLALVGREHAAAIGREGQHVGLRTHFHMAQQGKVCSLIEGDAAVGSLGLCLDGNGNNTPVNGHTVDFRASQNRFGGQFTHPHRLGGICQIQHINLARLRIDHEGALGRSVKSRDLGSTLAEHSCFVTADFLQREGNGSCLFNRLDGPLTGRSNRLARTDAISAATRDESCRRQHADRKRLDNGAHLH